MAETEHGTVFGSKATEQIAKTVREVTRRLMNETPHRARWQQHPGGGGGQRIWFTIISVECTYDEQTILTVSPTWYTGGCSASIPGEDSDGYVIVEDVCSILDYYTADWLVGQTGAATYMYPRNVETCEAKWLVDSICNSPECA